MEIMEVILGYGPILFSGAVVGAIASYFAPEIIKKMKANFDHKRIMDLHDRYQKNPQQFAQKRPELAEFFKKKDWVNCECPNCLWMCKQMGTPSNVEQDSDENAMSMALRKIMSRIASKLSNILGNKVKKKQEEKNNIESEV